MLDINQSRARQKRLLSKMAEQKLDAVVVGAPHHVYYFSTWWTHWLQQSAFVLFADGKSWMVTANQVASNVAADEVVSYEAQWLATLRQEQPRVVADLVAAVLKERGKARIGIDGSQVTSQLSMLIDAEIESVDPVLWQLRRCKDHDEIALIQEACTAAAAMYDHARKMIEPGISEIDVFAELHSVAVRTTREPMTAVLGNDFVCGPGGGPPRRDGRAKDGEIYILDLGPSYRGYFADTSRGFCVNHKPTDSQLEAWQVVIDCLQLVEKMARPGVKCATLFSAVDEYIRQKRGKGMTHHLGHGIGLQPHEFPSPVCTGRSWAEEFGLRTII
jgi:Xaa-Pro dipeptidase